MEGKPPHNDRLDRLDSWKEIAVYLGRTEKTARRWEQHEALPVHRLMHAERGSIYAFRSELDAWRAAHSPGADRLRSTLKQPSALRRTWTAVAALLVVGATYSAFMSPDRARPVRPVNNATTSRGASLSSNPQALQAFQRGSEFSRNPGRTQIETSISYLMEAVRLDPDFAAAHGALAIGHVALTFFGRAPSHETMAKARGYASRMLDLAPEAAAAHMALAGVSHWYELDHAQAEEHFRTAITRKPEGAGALNWQAEFLLEMRRFDEAFQASAKAGLRAPAWLEVDTVRGNIYLYMGRPADAIPLYLKALQLEPNHGLARFFLGQAYLAVARPSDAVTELRRAVQATDDAPFAKAGLAHALALAGRRDQAEDLLAEFERHRANGYYPAYALAMTHVGLGNHTQALNWLDRAFDERLLGYYLPSVGQMWDPLRSDPRFTDLLRRLGLPRAPT